MNYIELLKGMDFVSIGENYEYDSNFMLDGLFTQTKTQNLKVEVAQLVAGGTIPQMAQVHAFDTEARIGSRPDFQTMKFEKLLIKEKLNMGEALRYYVEELGASQTETALKNFVFNDTNTLIKRVLTRSSAMNGELLSTGKITIDENNLDLTVDFGLDIDNQITVTGWATVGTDVLGQLRAIFSRCRSKGSVIRRAITSTKQLERLLLNTAISTYMKDLGMAPTINNLTNWLGTSFGVEFIANDEVYTTDVKGGTITRIFDEDVVTLLPTLGTIGSGLWGVTPEEMNLASPTSGMVTTTKYFTEDPVAMWTKASGIYLPVIADINKMFIINVAS